MSDSNERMRLTVSEAGHVTTSLYAEGRQIVATVFGFGARPHSVGEQANLNARCLADSWNACRALPDPERDVAELRFLVHAYRGLVGNTGYMVDREMAQSLWERASDLLARIHVDQEPEK